MQFEKHGNLFGIKTKFQQLTMESLSGRFPHLVEDIFGQLSGKTLSSCSQINKIWKANLVEYRLHLVKKIQKRLKNQNIVYGPVEDSDKEENQTWPKITIETISISTWSTRFKEHPVALQRNITVEQLPRSDLIKILKYFCDYDGVFFLFLSNYYSTALVSPSQTTMTQEVTVNTPLPANEDMPHYKLIWKDHKKSFFEAAVDPCPQKQSIDVTLSCGVHNFPVNKLVLSVCSPYFR